MGRRIAHGLLTGALLAAGCAASWAGERPQDSPFHIAQAAPIRALADSPIAHDADIVTTDAGTVLTVRMTRSTTPSAFVLEAPDRVIVDLPVVNFQLPEDAGRRTAGLIRSFRYGLFGPGRSRIVIDLAQPARADVRVQMEEGSEHARLIVALSRVDRAAFAQLAKDLRSPQSAALAPPAPATDSRPLVVIDPGHGGVDPGARARTGLQEKALVFDVARVLREKLAKTGRYRVLMTRDEDVFVALGDRVKFARQAQADLFISIHADALSAHDGVRGASIYTGSDKASDAYAARLAESENRADAAAGAEAANEVVDDVNDILSDLTRRETRAFAHRFARTLIGDLGAAVPMHKTPLRSAGFRVLMAPDVPSVLIELGYLTNLSDIALLTSADGQAKAGAAIVTAIDNYFARRKLP